MAFFVCRPHSTVGPLEPPGRIRHVRAGDNPVSRVNRSNAYATLGRCEEAIADARTALKMGPMIREGYHTPTEAHHVPAICS